MRSERGQTLVWLALVLALVGLPLMALIADGTRLFQTRYRVQAAVDAACADAAWMAGDRRAFRDSGVTTFQPNWYLLSIAHSTFYNNLAEQGTSGYSAVLVVQPDYAAASLGCLAQVQVPLLVWPREVSFSVSARSAVRFR